MIRESFNTGWTINPMDGYQLFMNPDSGKKPVQVTLPFDAMQLEKRSPEVPQGRNTGYWPSLETTYAKDFVAPEAWRDQCVYLEFEGVYRDSMVYINGHYAGGCPHGYTCFKILCDPFLKYGQKNTVKVMAKAHQDSRWYPGCGIFRPVNLLVGNLCHLTPDGLRVSTPEIDDTGALVQVETEVTHRGHGNVTAQISLEIRDGAGEICATGSAPLTLYGGETETLTQRIFLPQARRWSVEEPNLYKVSVRMTEGETLMDEAETSFGVRSLSLDAAHGLRINGQTVKLRGACVHHDNGLLGAADIARAEVRRVQLLKAAGFNTVRSSHNPISRAFLEACDREGLLVMDELTDMWTQRKTDYDYSTAFPRHWPELVDAMVAKDFNHPSVIFYSIGNEIQENGTVHGAKIGRKLAQRIKTLDPTRYTVNSANLLMASMGQVGPADMMGEGQPDGSQAAQDGKLSTDINVIMQNLSGFMASLVVSDAVGRITEETFSCVDVAGYNYATARYEKDIEKYPNRIIMGSETFPAQIAENWALVQKHPQLIGDFTWTGWDYLGEAGIGETHYLGEPYDERNVWPWYIAYCGDLDITGFRRPVSYFREIVFGLRKQPYLAVRYPETFGREPKPGSWDFVDGICDWNWKGHEGKPVQVEVYAPGDTAALYLNGVKATEGKLEGYRCVLTLDYAPGELIAVCFENGLELSHFTVKTPEDSLKLQMDSDRRELRADDRDLAYLSITLTDQNGLVQAHSDRSVTVKVEGAGKLAGLGSANPKSEESFQQCSFTTFEGRLLAIVRPTGAGEIRVTVSAEGCETVYQMLKVQ